MEFEPRVAYFSMEIGLSADVPTYSGGLGVLAGDTIRAAADLKVPMVAVTLLHRKGYCRQILDAEGNQTEEPVDWRVEDLLTPLPARTSVMLEGREVHIGVWLREVVGYGGFRIPVYFLDTDLPENSDSHRTLTHHLYGGDQRYRLCQEFVLGTGGIRMLRAIGYQGIERFHMNEGHASLLTCEILAERLRQDKRETISPADMEAVRKACVFTTHTPVPAGHDQFPLDVVRQVLPEPTVQMLRQLSCVDGVLNMTYLALHLSRFVNGVARRHGEVSRQLFAPYSIDSITNGVHARTWVSPSLAEVFDEHMPTWREDSYSLRTAASIPGYQLWEAHIRAKRQLFNAVHHRTGIELDEESFTMGFARRSAAYKRADMLFDDQNRLRRIYHEAGPFQIVFAGKAHPADQVGKDVIRRIFRAAKALQDTIPVVYLADYDIELCRLLTSGCDVWLNTPEPPMEASGTSGMKAALNGVPSLSILDGWWTEGWIEGTTGWAIGKMSRGIPQPTDRAADVSLLYDKLQYVILPLYYHDRSRYIDVMRHAIAVNGSFFNTQRMMSQYVLKAYFR